jgi:hypothetical protein
LVDRRFARELCHDPLDLALERLNGIGKETDETIPFALVGSERGIFVSRGIFEQRVSASRAPIDAGRRCRAISGLKECCHAANIPRRALGVCTLFLGIASCGCAHSQ